MSDSIGYILCVDHNEHESVLDDSGNSRSIIL